MLRPLHETTEQPTTPEATEGSIAASALQAEAWAGEAFLRDDEDPAVVLAPGTARRQALDDALAEIATGRGARRSSGRCATGSCSASSAC